MNVVENIIINSNTEEEFRACEELEALYRSNKAAAGALAKKAEPKAGGLHRKAPLKAKTGLQRKTPLQTKSGLQSKPLASDAGVDRQPAWNGMKRNSPLQTRTPPKAKSPMKATPSKRHYGHLVKNGWCACCGKGTLETEWHHIIYRSHGGDEADENMLEVCRDCHAKIHAGEIGKDEVAFARLTAGCYLEENQRVIGAKA